MHAHTSGTTAPYSTGKAAIPPETAATRAATIFANLEQISVRLAQAEMKAFAEGAPAVDRHTGPDSFVTTLTSADHLSLEIYKRLTELFDRLGL